MNNTVFDKFKSMSIDELTDWLNQYSQLDSMPWIEWWNKNYCSKCDAVTAFVPDYGRELDFSCCELNDKCKFFQDLDDVPDDKMIIKMWLESEVN